MKFLKHVVDAVFVARPMLWIPVWGYVLLGYARGYVLSEGRLELFSREFCFFELYLWTFVFSCSVGCVYILNQFADIRVDRQNAGFALLADGNVSPVTGRFAAILLAGVSLLIPMIFNHPGIALFSFCALALGFVYSFKPLRFSGCPIADFFSNAFGYGVVAFGAGWYLAGQQAITWSFVGACLPYFIAMCGGSISSTIPDIDGDRREGKKTTAVVLGKRRAHALATVFVVVGAVAAWLQRDMIAFIWICAALPVYLMCLYKDSPRLIEASYKISGVMGMLLISLLFALFAPVGIFVLIATRIYFRFRFNVRYPSLLPAAHV